MFAAGSIFMYCLCMPTPPIAAARVLAPLPLDATIAYACDSVAIIDASACLQGYAVAIAAFFAICAQAVFTGYAPRETRRNVAHRTFRDGLCTPAPRVTADDRALASAQAWGLAS